MSSNKKRALILGYVWPEPTSSAAGVRTLSIVDDFLSFGYDVVFASTTTLNRFAEQLESRGVHCYSVSANDSTFDSWVKEMSPDVVVFDRFVLEEQFGWRVTEQCPDALRIIDTQDFHSLRRAREAGITHLNTEDTLRELASIYRSDLTLVLSSFEYDLINEKLKVPSDLLLCMGFSYPKPERETLPRFENRKNIAWIGNFRHPPNVDAVMSLSQKIWPEIYPVLNQKCPGIEIHLYGAYPPKEMMLLDQPKMGFRVMGPCENAQKTLSQYKVLFAPLKYGAGIKGKIADAWAAGTPVVTSAIGAEGMRLSPHVFAGIVSESIQDWAQGIQELCLDPEFWKKNQKLGFETLEQLFSQDQNRVLFSKKLEFILENKKELREKNKVGRILEREQLRSTKYFSKWIEAKNK